MIHTIISGGQTGADRAGLDWAILNSISHGGTCPKGRRAEDGIIPDRYNLTESTSTLYIARTEQNILKSDGTVIFTSRRSVGSEQTIKYADRYRKPYIELHSGLDDDEAGQLLSEFCAANSVAVLNVAGHRASIDPAIYARVIRVLDAAFKRDPIGA